MGLKVEGKLQVSFTSLGTALEARQLDSRALDLSSCFSHSQNIPEIYEIQLRKKMPLYHW